MSGQKVCRWKQDNSRFFKFDATLFCTYNNLEKKVNRSGPIKESSGLRVSPLEWTSVSSSLGLKAFVCARLPRTLFYQFLKTESRTSQPPWRDDSHFRHLSAERLPQDVNLLPPAAKLLISDSTQELRPGHESTFSFNRRLPQIRRLH